MQISTISIDLAKNAFQIYSTNPLERLNAEIKRSATSRTRG